MSTKVRAIYAWVTCLPLVWLISITMTAGWSKIFDPNPRHGFLATAHKYELAFDEGILLHPANSIEQMQKIILNNYIDAIITALFILLISTIVIDACRIWYKILIKKERLPIYETPFIPFQSSQKASGIK